MAKLSKKEKEIEGTTLKLYNKHCSHVQFNVMDLSKLTREAEQILANGGTEEAAAASIIKMREELRQN